MKAFVSIPIRLGATATKGDFVGKRHSLLCPPRWTKRQEVIATEDCHQITEEFYAATWRRFELRAGDVVLNRSGEALGKVALWDSEKPAVASDFTMRIRFNGERMNPRFAWFFFRSVMFQAQIQRELRGSSAANIFPPRWNKWSLSHARRRNKTPSPAKSFQNSSAAPMPSPPSTPNVQKLRR